MHDDHPYRSFSIAFRLISRANSEGSVLLMQTLRHHYLDLRGARSASDALPPENYLQWPGHGTCLSRRLRGAGSGTLLSLAATEYGSSYDMTFVGLRRAHRFVGARDLTCPLEQILRFSSRECLCRGHILDATTTARGE